MTSVSPRTRLFIGLFCVAAGVMPILAAFDVGPLHQRDINGPPWLAVAAGGVFVLAGALLIAGESARHHPLSYLAAFLVIGAFAAIGNWIAFGPGPRQCSGGLSAMFFTVERQSADIECRIAFGIGAGLLNGALLWMLAAGLRKLTGPGMLANGVEKLGTGIFMLALLPVLMLMFVFIGGKRAWDFLAEFVRTGRWPRKPQGATRMKK